MMTGTGEQLVALVAMTGILLIWTMLLLDDDLGEGEDDCTSLFSDSGRRES